MKSILCRLILGVTVGLPVLIGLLCACVVICVAKLLLFVVDREQ